MKKIIVACISFLILIVVMVLAVYIFRPETNTKKDESTICIVATLFPQYDFAKHIVKDKANVKLLLNSGVEAHNYEPTAKDMIEILDDTDIFLYNGVELEPWTAKIVDNLKETDCDILNVSNNIKLITIEDFEEKHINQEIVYDSHKEDEEHHEEIYDEHIWLNPKNAIVMIDNIVDELCKIDKENADFYKKNAEEYKKEINALAKELEDLVNSSERKEIAVGGEFAYSYLVDEYGINFVSVYTNCGEGEDPSIAKVKSVIDYINNHNIPVVYYEELSEGTVTKMISEETNTEALVLYSIHNGDAQKDSYVSLMKRNIENLKKGLN